MRLKKQDRLFLVEHRRSLKVKVATDVDVAVPTGLACRRQRRTPKHRRVLQRLRDVVQRVVKDDAVIHWQEVAKEIRLTLGHACQL